MKAAYNLKVSEVIIERLRIDNTTATQRNEEKEDSPLIFQLQLNFFTVREIPRVVLSFRNLSNDAGKQST